jgi:hypothetical protein
MADIIQAHDGASTIEAILEGGPDGLALTHRRCRVVEADDKIKVPYLGGYEHFERTSEYTDHEGAPRRVYRWTTRTKIAE